jgi:L-rhamnose mutarotase
MVDPREARTGSRAVKRFGQVIGLERTRLAEYQRYHAKIWPEIEQAIREAGIRNYSIFHHDGQLFGYYEYVGPEHEYAARMQALARAPRMREWWDIMESMQIPVPGRAPGEWWAEMQEVFHQD